MIISVHNQGGEDVMSKTSSIHVYDFPNEPRQSRSSPDPVLSSTSALFLSALLSKTGLLVLISLFLGVEAGRSTGSFCLAVISFLGGSRHSQQDTPLLVLVFLGGFFVGYNKATVVTVLLSWLVAYACQLRLKDAALMTVGYWLGTMANVSHHVFFVVVFSFFGGKAVQVDQGIYIYLCLSVLVASMGKMNEPFPFFRDAGIDPLV